MYLEKDSKVPEQESTSQSADLHKPKPCPSTASDMASLAETASTSASQSISKLKKRKQTSMKSRKKGKKAKESKDKTICPVCRKQYEESEVWLACDICDTWYHQNCTKNLK